MREVSEVLKDLAKIRKESGIAIEEIQRKLQESYGINSAVKTIYGWESGKVQPPLKTFVVLCEIYEVKDIYDLFSEEGDKLVEDIAKDKKLVKKYYNRKEMQRAVDKLLGL